MLFQAEKFLGIAVQAKDGEIGKVKDMFFDDKTWAVRYIVVACGSWFDSNDVLLIPSSLQVPNALLPILLTSLTKEQVVHSPKLATDLPVSRQYEGEMHSYYSWEPYWSYPAFGYGFSAYYPDTQETAEAHLIEEEEAQDSDFDPQLRSLKEVIGYHIKASDEELGNVVDVLISRESAEVTHFVVDTQNWWPSKHVLIEVGSIRTIDWGLRTIGTTLDKETIKGAPEFDDKDSFNSAYMEKLWAYYHRNSTPWRSARHKIDATASISHPM